MVEERSSRQATAAATVTAIDVAIVSYRSRELLRSCLESLRVAEPTGGTRVYVVDNSSDDGTVEMVRAEFPGVVLIPSERNLGFGAATNLGDRGRCFAVRPRAQSGHAHHARLARPAAGGDGRAAGGRHLRLPPRPRRRQLRPRGASFVPDDRRRARPLPRRGAEPVAPPALTQYRAPGIEAGPVDAVNGAFMLIRRSALDEVGPFDEGFWMYMEDLDLCFRFHEAGWITWYEPSVDAYHVKGGSSGTIAARD